MEIDMGIGGLEFGSGVTRFPGLVLVVHCSNSLPSPPVTQWGLQATAGGDMLKGFGGTIYVSSSVKPPM